MPRTKRVAASKPLEVKANNKSKIEEHILKQLNDRAQMNIELLDQRLEEELKQVRLDFKAFITKYPKGVLNRTIIELKNGEVEDDISMALSDVTNTFNATRTVTTNTTSTRLARKEASHKTKSTTSSDGGENNKTKVRSNSRCRRSISAGEDEGYTTAESTRGTNSGGTRNTTRQSRSKTRTQPKPLSRSLSRNASSKINSYMTPVNARATGSTGTITPKCKPNTPLLYVRRPKVGEMGWSNQGSPLLVTGTIASEQTANVNIPLGGDILSMLPTRGVRESQIPDLDQETRRQLEILRDNLIKVCSKVRK